MIRSNRKSRLPMALFGAALVAAGLAAGPAAAGPAATEPAAAGPAAATGELVVRDFVLTNDIVGREPINEATSFTIHDKRAFAFARLNNTGAPTAVNVVWHYEGTQHGSVWLNVGKSPGWRTWSSANLKPGNWSVTLVDAEGSVLVQRSFNVGPTAEAMAGIDQLMVEAPVPAPTLDVDTVAGVDSLMVEEPTSTAGDPDESVFYPME